MRPAIKVELNYAPMRRPTVMLPVRSFVAEARNRPLEVAETTCVSIVETAAEKLVSLRRALRQVCHGMARQVSRRSLPLCRWIILGRGRMPPASNCRAARGSPLPDHLLQY